MYILTRREIAHTSKIYFENLKIHHKHLYDLEIEKEKGKYFSTRNSPLDWIVWYDSYNSIPRDPNFLYGHNVQTAQYFQDPSYLKNQGLIKLGETPTKI